MRKQLDNPNYGQEEMKNEEVLLFVETSMENGSDASTALQDFKMIDAMLKMKKLHFAVHGQVKKTASGYGRKGSTLYNALEGIVEARAEGAFNY